MSRGGRGGFRGGRMKMGGQDLPWEYDPDLRIETRPDDTFPAIEIPRPKPPTDEEKRIVNNYRRFRNEMHEGPLYGVLGDDMKVGKSHLPKGARFNPFDGMPTYSKKFKKDTRKYANFSSRTYSLEFFPRELWDAVDAKIQPTIRSNTLNTKGMTPEEQARALQQMEELANAGEDGEEKADGEAKDNSDDEAQSINEDDDLSDDDDEMAGDYNAEGYFDTGEGDDGWGEEEAEDDGGYD